MTSGESASVTEPLRCKPGSGVKVTRPQRGFLRARVDACLAIRRGEVDVAEPASDDVDRGDEQRGAGARVTMLWADERRRPHRDSTAAGGTAPAAPVFTPRQRAASLARTSSGRRTGCG